MGPKAKNDSPTAEDLEKSLTLKERLFVLEYQANGGNATQAAIAAGYSAKCAAVQGSQNLRKPKIRAFLEGRLKQGKVGELELTIERLEEELARIALLDPRRAYDKDGRLLSVPEMPEDVARALAGYEVEAAFDWVDDPNEPGMKKKRAQVGFTTKVRWPNKTEAILLGLRRRGALIDRQEVEHSGNVSVSISINGIKRKAAAP